MNIEQYPLLQYIIEKYNIYNCNSEGLMIFWPNRFFFLISLHHDYHNRSYEGNYDVQIFFKSKSGIYEVD